MKLPPNPIMLDIEAMGDELVGLGMVHFNPEGREICNVLELWNLPDVLPCARRDLQWWQEEANLPYAIAAHKDVSACRSALHKFLDPIKDPWLVACPAHYDIPWFFRWLDTRLGGSHFNLARKRVIDGRSFAIGAGVWPLPPVERDQTFRKHRPDEDALHQVDVLFTVLDVAEQNACDEAGAP